MENNKIPIYRAWCYSANKPNYCNSSVWDGHVSVVRYSLSELIHYIQKCFTLNSDKTLYCPEFLITGKNISTRVIQTPKKFRNIKVK